MLHRGQRFEARIALLEWKIDPSSAPEPPVFIVFGDSRLERAVGMLLRFDEEIEPSGCAAVGDPFVALALPAGTDPLVIVRLEPQVRGDPRYAADVVEHNEAAIVRHEHIACLEHRADARWLK